MRGRRGVVGVLDRIPIREKLGCESNGILSRRTIKPKCDIIVRFVTLVLQANKPRATETRPRAEDGKKRLMWSEDARFKALRSLLHYAVFERPLNSVT